MKLTLKQIRQKLQNILNLWSWRAESISTQSGTYMKTSGLVVMRQIINDLDEIDIFNDLIVRLKESAIFTSGSDSMQIQLTEGSNLNERINFLKTLLDNFLKVLITSVPEEDQNSVNIKLPEVGDFNELSIVSREIHIGLSQILFNEEINGQTKIVSVENGSIWFNVFVGATALGVIASLIWAAAVIHKKILEGRLLEEQIRGLKVRNESLEDIMRMQKSETDLLIQAEAEHINSEHFQSNQAENIERIKNSIKIFSDLISKGAEIQPALVAPENVANLFPDPKNLIGIESKIKRLGNAG